MAYGIRSRPTFNQHSGARVRQDSGRRAHCIPPVQTQPQSPPSLRRRPRHLHRPAGSCRFPWRRCLPAKKKLTRHTCPYMSSPEARTHGHGLDVGGRCKCHILRQQDLCLDEGRGWLQHRTVSTGLLRTRPMLFPQQLHPRRRTRRRRSRRGQDSCWARERSTKANANVSSMKRRAEHGVEQVK